MIEQEIVLLPTIKPLLGEFPTDTLPKWVRDFVEHSARALGVPTDLIAIPVLVDISVGIGNNWRIQLKPSYQERASVYGAIIGNPGVMKSPALQAGVQSTSQIAKYPQQYQAHQNIQHRLQISLKFCRWCSFELEYD